MWFELPGEVKEVECPWVLGVAFAPTLHILVALADCSTPTDVYACLTVVILCMVSGWGPTRPWVAQGGVLWLAQGVQNCLER